MDKMNKKELISDQCFICGADLSEENSSDEHILLNALGGHIHSNKLICKACNSAFGRTSDEELAKEMRFFASYLDVPRQRGKNQKVRTLDEKYDMMPGGVPVLRNPIVKKTEYNKGFAIEAEVRDESELRRILRELAKKYPGIDVQQALLSKVEKNDTIDHLQVSAEFHAHKIFPSIIKSAVEFYLLCGGDRLYIQHLVPVIKGEADCFDCCMFYYPKTSFFHTVIGNMEHILYVNGNTENRLLYGYVSYFGVMQCMVLLNDSYDGPDLENGYAYQVITNESKKVIPQYGLSRERINEILNTSFLDNYRRVKDAVGYYIMNADLIKIQQSVMPELEEYYKEQCERVSRGEINTYESRRAIVKKYTDLITPWLKKYMRKEEKLNLF